MRQAPRNPVGGKSGHDMRFGPWCSIIENHRGLKVYWVEDKGLSIEKLGKESASKRAESFSAEETLITGGRGEMQHVKKGVLTEIPRLFRSRRLEPTL